MSIRLVTVLLAPLVFALAGCPTGKDPLACQDACSHQTVKTFCDIDGVYPDSSLANECIAPPSADACNRIETCTGADKPYCTDESMGECVECVDGSHCADGEVCDSGSHSCVMLACTPGADGDAACLAADASLPFCSANESCVACLESSQCTVASAGVCDPNDFECRGCIANSECESKLCGLDNGVCADAADIVYVATTGADDGACGTLSSPCLTITEGLTKVTGSRDTVVVGAGEYVEQVVINGLAVKLVGDGAVNINPSLGAGEVAVSISGTSDVSFDGMDIALSVGGSAGSIALKCETGANTTTLAFENGTILGSAGLGIEATRCGLTITGSTIKGNDGGGIDISNSDFTIVNNFIAFNGANDILHPGVQISSNATTQRFDFNTIVGNQVSSGTSGVSCATVTPLTATGNVVYSGVGGGAISGNCSWEYSDIEGGQAGTGNIDLDPLLVNSSAISGDYHLQSTSPCIDAADPAATLDTDIDGDLRPQGAARDMGADEAG